MGKGSPSDVVDAILAVKRSVDLLVKLKLQDEWRDMNRTRRILFLNSHGCTPAEIAGFLGTTSGTVRPILSRSRKKSK